MTILGDRFELGPSVGRGAFAEVFRGTDLHTKQPVAIKWLHDEHRLDPTARERFSRESRLVSRVQSEHVVAFIARGEDLDRPWMALQWLEGQDLAKLMAKERIAPHFAVEIARQAALGLASLHRAGIIHRDLKPSNFFVHTPSVWPKDLHVTLIDLGVARAPSEEDITLDGVRVGTPSYMSPEQARGEERLAAQSDLYSLAVVLYEMLSGRKPFIGHDPFAILARIVLEDPMPLEAIAPELSQEIFAFVAKGMARDPFARFESAMAMAEALGRMTDVPQRPSMPGHDSTERTAQLRVPTPDVSLERRVVTTVVADLRDCPVANDAAQEFQRVHQQHSGVVQKVLGRRAIALFGASRTAGDESMRAARAALSFVNLHPQARVAIVTARTLARGGSASLDSLERFSTELTRAQGIIALDEESARALHTHFVIEGPPGAQVLRGERAGYTAVSARLLGRDVAFVGRDREIAQLEEALGSSAKAKANGCCLLLGPAGIGKSRLRVEFLKHLELKGTRFSQLVLRCDPMLKEVPFGVLGRALRHKAMIEPDDLASVRHAALLRWARSLGVESEMESLAALTGFDSEIPGNAMESEARRETMNLAVAKVFSALGAQHFGRLVLQVEDLHWLDDATLEAVRWALESPSDAQLFVLALGRAEVLTQWPQLWAASLLKTIVLQPLMQSETEQLVLAAVSGELSAERKTAIVERSMGNPLFVEELVRLAQSQQDNELPLAIQAAFQGRLDCLPLTVKRGAIVASVLGPAVWPDALSAMQPELDAQAVLAALTHNEILVHRQRARLGRRGEFVWRHALLRETAYAMLSPEELQSFHGLAADWLERAGERDSAVLAEHFAKAKQYVRAATLYFAAARAALREGANEATLAHCTRALALGELEPELRAQIHSQAAAAAHRLGQYDRGLTHSENGLLCAQTRTMRLMLSAQRALTLRRFGRVDESIELLQLVLKDHSESEDRLQAECWSARQFCELEFAWADIHRMRWNEAEMRAQKLVNELSVGTEDTLKLAVHHALAQALHGGEKLEFALKEHRLVVEHAEKMGLRWRAEGARVGLGQVLLALGLTTAAMRELSVAVERSRSARLPSTEAFARHHLARALLRVRRLEEAKRENRAVSALANDLKNPMLIAISEAFNGVVAVQEGHFVAAAVYAKSAMEHRHLPRGWRAAAVAVEACALAAQGARFEAVETAERAVDAMAEGGEDEGDECALAALFSVCEVLGLQRLAARATAATRARFTARIERIEDPALRANVRALEAQVTASVL